MARKAFNELTTPYKNRLLFREAGGKKAFTSLTFQERVSFRQRVAREHSRANLTEARGHPSPRPAGSVATDVMEKILYPNGPGPDIDFEHLTNYFTWPTWVPRDISSVDPTNPNAPRFPVTDKVAAALSQFPHPKRWTHVEFLPREDEPWTMTVSLKGNAYDRSFLIPGDGGAGGEAKQVLAIVTLLQSSGRPRQTFEDIFFEVLGSPGVREAVAA